MKNYPSLFLDASDKNPTIDDIKEFIRYVTKERRNDVNDFTNLKNTFLSGRLVGKVPTGAADISPTDRVGDTNFDYATGFMYRVVDNAGTAVWARVALDTSW